MVPVKETRVSDFSLVQQSRNMLRIKKLDLGTEMREKNGFVIIDYLKDGKRSTFSINRALVYLDASTREGGLEETIRVIKTLAEKGKSSREVVTGVCLGLSKRLNTFKNIFEAKTGESALYHLDNRNRISALKKHTRDLAQESGSSC